MTELTVYAYHLMDGRSRAWDWREGNYYCHSELKSAFAKSHSKKWRVASFILSQNLKTKYLLPIFSSGRMEVVRDGSQVSRVSHTTTHDLSVYPHTLKSSSFVSWPPLPIVDGNTRKWTLARVRACELSGDRLWAVPHMEEGPDGGGHWTRFDIRSIAWIYRTVWSRWPSGFEFLNNIRDFKFVTAPSAACGGSHPFWYLRSGPEFSQNKMEMRGFSGGQCNRSYIDWSGIVCNRSLGGLAEMGQSELRYCCAKTRFCTSPSR